MKPFPKKLKKFLWTSFCLIAGNALLAFLVAAFIIPHNILMGGTTGIGILLDNILPESMVWLETAWIVLALNVLLLLLGLVILGKKFFFKTVVSSILYPILLAGMQRIPGITSLTDNSLMAVLFAGGILGIAAGLVFRVGASTGGTDVVNLVLHKWFHLPVSVFVYIVDFIILGAQAVFVFINPDGNPESILLGAVLLVVETLVLDRVMIFGKAQIQIFVVSEKYNEIRHALLEDLEAGVTMTMIETGRLSRQQQAVLCVIPPRKLYAANEIVRKIDPDAFVTVTKIKEVRGQGFTRGRHFQEAIRPDELK